VHEAHEPLKAMSQKNMQYIRPPLQSSSPMAPLGVREESSSSHMEASDTLVFCLPTPFEEGLKRTLVLHILRVFHYTIRLCVSILWEQNR